MTAASRYDLTDQIGHGPNGTVWRAWDRATGEVVAVKVLHRHLGTDPGVVDRFRRERPVLTGYFHDALVRVRDLITEHGVCLVTELVDGLDLRYHLATSGQVPAPVAGQIAAAAAAALAAAHTAGAVHGDVKPANLLIEEMTGHVRVTDLRVARLARGSLGPANPEYVAPEVLAGGPPVPASDVYALCAVLVEMLTGAVPFLVGTSPYLSGSRVAPLPGRLPALLRPLVAEGLRPEPDRRPTAAQLAVELYAMLPALALVVAAEPAGAPAHLPRTPPARRPTPAHGRQPRHAARRLSPLPVLAGVAAAVIVAGSAVAGAALISTGDGDGTGTGPTPTSPPAPSPPAGDDGTDVAPRLPMDAGSPTVEGASMFVHYWFDAVNYAASTGRATALTEASSPDCVECEDVVRMISEGSRGARLTVRQTRVDGFWNTERPRLYVIYDRAPRGSLDPAPAATFLTCQAVLERAGDRWRMQHVLSNSPLG